MKQFNSWSIVNSTKFPMNRPEFAHHQSQVRVIVSKGINHHWTIYSPNFTKGLICVTPCWNLLEKRLWFAGFDLEILLFLKFLNKDIVIHFTSCYLGQSTSNKNNKKVMIVSRACLLQHLKFMDKQCNISCPIMFPDTNWEENKNFAALIIYWPNHDIIIFE